LKPTTSPSGCSALRNALGHAAGGNAPRLGVANQPPALPLRRIAHAPAQRQGDFGQLRGFARAGFATDDDDLVRKPVASPP
jgi:hypothetical protein